MGVHRPHLRSKHIFPQTNIEHTKIVTIKIKLNLKNRINFKNNYNFFFFFIVILRPLLPNLKGKVMKQVAFCYFITNDLEVCEIDIVML